MLRLIYVVLVSLPFVIWYLNKVAYVEKHSEKYTEEARYEIARKAVSIMKRNGRIETLVYGTEHLPAEGGYVMYANHQGKYDALGIISSHNKPCTILIDAKRSMLPLTNEFITLLKGSRLDKSNMKSQLKTILSVIEEVKAGRRYIVFPEGGYYHNRNEVHDFLPGAFKCAIKAKAPIVPVVLIDSYKPFELNSLRKVKTQVHFLEPICYPEYKDLTSREIADLTRSQIMEVIRLQSK